MHKQLKNDAIYQIVRYKNTLKMSDYSSIFIIYKTKLRKQGYHVLYTIEC